MKPSHRLVAAAVVSAALTGCAATQSVTDYREDVVKRTEALRTGPAQRPRLTDTSFASALRCMDLIFSTYGVRDLVVLVEDLPDPTRKVNAGGKDMIISAVSQMTRRSRAVRLIAFSAGDLTLREMIERQALAMSERPEYVIRGSISQFDESLVKKQGEAGVALGPLSGGYARQGGSSMLGLDLNIIQVPSLALVPGVTSRNSVLVMREGSGTDAELEIRKFGLNFNFSLARTEGTAQALRTLAELATIELFGKLAKVPYWTCLGGSAADPAIASELVDWWETLVADPPSLFRWLQQQMRARGLYAGPVNGRADEALVTSVQAYQQALGMAPNAEVDFEFFKRYLAADHTEVEKRARAQRPSSVQAASQEPASAAVPGGPGATASAPTSTPTPSQAAKPAQAAAPVPASAPPSAPPASSQGPAQAAAQSASPPAVVVRGGRGPGQSYTRGEAFSVDVSLDRDGFVYCYLIDERRRVNPFFPNPLQTSPAVKAGTRMSFPGNLPFRFIANDRGVTETVACFASPAALGPQPLAGVTSVRDADELAAAFRRVAGERFSIGRYDVLVK